MDLSGIISVSGMTGLYKVVTQTRTGLLVESMTDGKRLPVYSTTRVSALDDISIYGQKEDVPLKDVLRSIRDKTGSKAFDANLNDSAALKKSFREFLPDFDEARVYTSDIKKVFLWYNQLLDKNLLVEKEGEPEKQDESKSKTDAAAKPLKAAAKSKETKKAAPKASSKGMAKTQTVRKTGG